MKLRSLFALILVVATHPAGVAAKTWEVTSDTPSDAGQRITDALANALEGDRIHIHAARPDSGHSEYMAPPGGWKIKKSIEIFGDGIGMQDGDQTSTYLQPAGPNDPVFVIDMSETAIEHFLENIYIHDLQIGPTAPPSTYSENSNGIIYKSTEDKFLLQMKLERVLVLRMGNDGFHFEGPDNGFGITGLTMINCEAKANKGDGLDVRNAAMFTLIGGWFNKNGLNGAYLKCEPRILGTGFEANLQDRYAGGLENPGLAELFLESSHGFEVQGAHFELFETGLLVSDCSGGRIADCTFGNKDLTTGTRGIVIGFPTTTGILIEANSFSKIDILVSILDDPNITSCTILPQSVDNATPGNGLLNVPETADRGHIVFGTTTRTSNVTAGIGLPRLTSGVRDSMPSGASGGSKREGMLVYNDASDVLSHWDGTRWREEVTVLARYDTTAAGPIGRPLLTLPAGMYRISVYAITKAPLPKAKKITLSWTDGSGRTYSLADLGASAGSLRLETVPIYTTGGNLSFSTADSGGGGGPPGSYDLRLRVEAVP